MSKSVIGSLGMTLAFIISDIYIYIYGPLLSPTENTVLFPFRKFCKGFPIAVLHFQTKCELLK